MYNLYFHPLSAFPGPPLRAAFHLPYLWSLFRGVSVQETKAFHDKYGSVVRIHPKALSFNSAQAWKGQLSLNGQFEKSAEQRTDIYGFRGGKLQLPKDEEWFVDHSEPVNIISMMLTF